MARSSSWPRTTERGRRAGDGHGEGSDEAGGSPRSFASATNTFGLVTVPVRLLPATRTSAGVSFHLLHAKDHVRVKQQFVCPEDGEVVSRSDMVKGYEHAKGEDVVFEPEELKALDQKATQGIEVDEFVPLETVDPVFFEKTCYLAPDRGGDRGYALLAEAMERQKLAAVAQYAARGKDYLMLLRAAAGRLELHQLFHADEVRPVSAKYRDEVRRRIREAIKVKVKAAS